MLPGRFARHQARNGFSTVRRLLSYHITYRTSVGNHVGSTSFLLSRRLVSYSQLQQKKLPAEVDNHRARLKEKVIGDTAQRPQRLESSVPIYTFFEAIIIRVSCCFGFHLSKL